MYNVYSSREGKYVCMRARVRLWCAHYEEAMEQTRDQASVTNAKLTARIQGQADDIRALQEGRVLDRAEFARQGRDNL